MVAAWTFNLLATDLPHFFLQFFCLLLSIIVLEYLSGKKVVANKNRGNVQVSTGIACGQSLNKRSTIPSDYGVAMPAKLRDTELFCDEYVAMSRIGKEIGIGYCQDNWVTMNEGNEFRSRRFANNREYFPMDDFPKNERNCFEQYTFAVLKDQYKLTAHVDDENCRELSNLLSVSQWVKDPSNDNKLVRMTFLGYMRKSVKDCQDRIAILRRLGPMVDSYWNDLEDYQKTNKPEDYYDHLGTNGFVVWADDDNEVKHVVALQSPPTDKAAYYTSTAANAFLNLKEKVQLSNEDAVELWAAYLKCNSVDNFSHVLNSYAAEGELPKYDRERDFLLARVTSDMMENFGGVQKTALCRFQPFLQDFLVDSSRAKDKDVTARSWCRLALDYVRRHQGKPPSLSSDSSKKDIQAKHKELLEMIQKAQFAGELKANDGLQFAVLTGIINEPMLLTHATCKYEKSGVKNGKWKISMDDFLGMRNQKQKQTVAEAIAHYLGVSVSIAENIICETIRKNFPWDIFGVGDMPIMLSVQPLALHRVPANGQRRLVKPFTPVPRKESKLSFFWMKDGRQFASLLKTFVRDNPKRCYGTQDFTKLVVSKKANEKGKLKRYFISRDFMDSLQSEKILHYLKADKPFCKSNNRGTDTNYKRLLAETTVAFHDALERSRLLNKKDGLRHFGETVALKKNPFNIPQSARKLPGSGFPRCNPLTKSNLRKLAGCGVDGRKRKRLETRDNEEEFSKMHLSSGEQTDIEEGEILDGPIIHVASPRKARKLAEKRAMIEKKLPRPREDILPLAPRDINLEKWGGKTRINQFTRLASLTIQPYSEGGNALSNRVFPTLPIRSKDLKVDEHQSPITGRRLFSSALFSRHGSSYDFNTHQETRCNVSDLIANWLNAEHTTKDDKPFVGFASKDLGRLHLLLSLIFCVGSNTTQGRLLEKLNGKRGGVKKATDPMRLVKRKGGNNGERRMDVYLVKLHQFCDQSGRVQPAGHGGIVVMIAESDSRNNICGAWVGFVSNVSKEWKREEVKFDLRPRSDKTFFLKIK